MPHGLHLAQAKGFLSGLVWDVLGAVWTVTKHLLGT